MFSVSDAAVMLIMYVFQESGFIMSCWYISYHLIVLSVIKLVLFHVILLPVNAKRIRGHNKSSYGTVRSYLYEAHTRVHI